MSYATTTSTEHDTEFNLANPTLAAEGEGIGSVDPNASSSRPPRPPRAGTYLIQWDFIETDPDKRFEYGTQDKPDLDRLTTRIRGTIIGCERVSHGDPLSYEEKHWLNRKIGGGFGYRLTTLPVMGAKGTSWAVDFLKAYGWGAKEIAAYLVDDSGHKASTYQESRLGEAITDVIQTGTPVRVYVDWEWRGKTETLINPDTGKPYYVQRSFKKDEPLNAVPDGMKALELDHESGEYPYFVQALVAVNGDGKVTAFKLRPSEQDLKDAESAGEEYEVVTLYAELAVRRFMPPKKG